MASKRNGNIANYFQSQDGGKSNDNPRRAAANPQAKSVAAASKGDEKSAKGKGKRPISNSSPAPKQRDGSSVDGSAKEEASVIKCICGFSDDDGHSIRCTKCDTWQHIVCYYESASSDPKTHDCVDCVPRPVDAKAAAENQRLQRERTVVEKEPKKRPKGQSQPDTKRNTKPAPRTSQTHFSSKDLSANWLSTMPKKPSDGAQTTFSVTVNKGDLFGGASADTLLIHACNTQGSWGAGIARAFRDRYPKAYIIYRNFCTREYDPATNPIPTGTALLIPPVDAGKNHWIGCLFTSAKYGKAKSSPEVIVRNTVPAMQMLLELVRLAGGVGEVRMCKINSGLFAVPWPKTTEALESIQVQDGWKESVDVWEP